VARAGVNTKDSSAAESGSLIQPVAAGVLGGLVAFASAFAIVLQGLAAVGATPAQATSGLLAVSVGMGLLSIGFSVATRKPITIAWSTPGAALLVGVGVPQGGFGVAVSAFLLAGVLVIVAGLWRPLGRAVANIPSALANAMLAGVLLGLCLAPVQAMATLPMLTAPVLLVWALGYRFAPRYAVAFAVVVAAVLVALVTKIPTDAWANVWPSPVWVKPVIDIVPVISIAVPLFIVTMASQNVPGFAVLRSNGYEVDARGVFGFTGLVSMLTAPFGGHAVNLAAISAALCAGPEAGADTSRRYIASIVFGVVVTALGLCAGFATAFVAASPPLLIQTVAGLALLTSLGGALAGALNNENDRLPAVITFVTTASGVSMLGIGAAFWGLVAGGGLLLLMRAKLADVLDA
jgi:benzoate membrane transport protein